MNSARNTVFLVFAILGQSAAHAGSTYPCDRLFGHGFEVSSQTPAALTICPGDWTGAWIGARHQFTAVVTDATGQVLDDQLVGWVSGTPAAIDIDQAGFATALQSGGPFLIHAYLGGLSDSVEASVLHDGSSGPGVMYTVWFARSDNAPAILQNGLIDVPRLGGFYDARAEPTPPWPDGGSYSTNKVYKPPTSGSAARNTIAKFQWDGDRIGLLTDVANGAGTFRVKDRTGEWVNLSIAHAVDFQLEGNRIAVVLDDDRFRVKTGIHGTWVTIASAPGLKSFQLDHNFIGALYEDDALFVKDGIHGPWIQLANPGAGVDSFEIDFNYIGVLFDDGTFRIKHGVNGPWTELASTGSGVASFRIEAQSEYDIDDQLYTEVYVGLLFEDGGLLVKRGINGPWVTLADSGIADFQFQGNPHRNAEIDEIRIGALYDDGWFRVKEGVSGVWSTLGTDVHSFQFQDNLIGAMNNNGSFNVKQGVQGEWVHVKTYGSGVTQYQLLVDVPAPPHRTTKPVYDYQQASCAVEHGNDPDSCYFEDVYAVPVPVYGRFCGGGRPADGDSAMAKGAIDGFDWTCKHHDRAFDIKNLPGTAWYPEVSTQLEAACIVAYAVWFSRLTHNGVFLASGWDDSPATSGSWDDAWNSVNMANLKGVLGTYSALTSVCTGSNWDDFLADTASQN